MHSWKHALLYIAGIGVSNLGSWIYLVAINLLVLNMTGSPAAVAGLFIIRPLATLLTNSWAGSIIDRANKRTLMIVTDVIRGGLIALIPFMTSVWGIYTIMFLISVAGAFFGPTSITYVTKLVPAEQRKTFNAWSSFASSGAALLGPAISGVLIAYTDIRISIIINAVSFFLCALAIYFLPDVDAQGSKAGKRAAMTLKTLVQDWIAVIDFGKAAAYFVLIYILFQSAMLLGFALDSQEATFIKQVLQLGDEDYGLLVSVAGAGYLAGSAAASFTVKWLSVRMLIGAGTLLSSAGYFVFYASNGYAMAAAGFVIFGFFSSFANAGCMTFFQNQVPIDLMGRFSSVTRLLEGIVQILLTLLLGVAADLWSLQTVCLIGAGAACAVSIILLIAAYVPSKALHYESQPSAGASS
ncbi:MULTISPECIES: MFS transporter [Paenibacillus]|uniref:Major facilitator superfamily MFS_1 n=2 Tax=Paenibacillus lactis TaxID=228574 RepID=G4HPL0_9BACL|nr:MFS transporter [Paenibacillus lactis]EHB47917.1 major facilitator superfamily MFS_1 [Paenibacillus lactis 154]MBP1896695.1 MFS family permease [Paenibacillus lactis]MCM3493995.1 MFS transporter [Paenibacillus lactis]GIO94618.1 MFS transporter [Paenibacillus lactis]HAG01099.1 MFS transporter [Paenibacillus lactis]